MMHKPIKLILSLVPILLLLACANEKSSEQAEKDYFEIESFSPTDTLFKRYTAISEYGDAFCYLNQAGDTIIPLGRYTHSFTDTLVTFGVVVEKNGERQALIGINQKGQKLYEIQWYDNGPDYLAEGLFRIIRHGKTGFADATGKIVIAPQFDCAFPFSGGKARVSNDCSLENDLEHTEMNSDSWFYIDKNGMNVK